MDEKKTTWERNAGTWTAQANDANNKYTRLLYAAAELIGRHIGSGRALDIGCGPGLFCEKLTELGFEAYGTDIAENMIQAAVSRMTGKVSCPEAHFRVCTDGEIPFDDLRFDLISAIQLFPYIAHYSAYIRKLASLLTPGGLVVASNTNRFSLWVMHEMLDRGFRIPPHLRTLRNLARTGYHSGGHVDYGTAEQAYCANRFDALFVAEGFRVIDGMDYYHIGHLDRDPVHRKGLGRHLARRLAWHHLGIYQKDASGADALNDRA